MIKELSVLGETIRRKNGGVKSVHDALKDESYSIDLVLDEFGNFDCFMVLEKMSTQAEAIAAKKGKARLLLDKAEEILCYTGKEGKEKAGKKHKLFMEKLDDYGEVLAIKPVFDFYNSNKANGLEKALENFESQVEEKERNGNIAFRLKTGDRRIHEEEEVYQAIISKYDKKIKRLLLESSKVCSVCGRKEFPVIDEPHGMIKRVPEGQTSGCALVSYNDNAYESYGFSGNDNSSICTHCAITYVEGLNWLMSNGDDKPIEDKKGKVKSFFKYSNRKNFGTDSTMVYWTRKSHIINEIDFLEAPKDDDVSNFLDSVTSGDSKRFLEDDVFYSCTLSGAAARIFVRDWIEVSLSDVKHSIAQWFKDIAIDGYNFDLKRIKVHYARLYDLAKSCQNDKEVKKVILSRVANHLWAAAIKKTAPPIWILSALLKRLRVDGKGVASDQAALLRLLLNRNNKGGYMIQERLDPDNKTTAYCTGRVFAVLESIQHAALGKTNAGIRERFFTATSTTPASAIGRLLKNAQNHLSKLSGDKPGLAVVLDKELTALIAKIDNLPTTFSLEEQGQFAIGYYHQKNFHFNKPELKEIQENSEELK